MVDLLLKIAHEYMCKNNNKVLGDLGFEPRSRCSLDVRLANSIALRLCYYNKQKLLYMKTIKML